jgi:hypothetical protein
MFLVVVELCGCGCVCGCVGVCVMVIFYLILYFPYYAVPGPQFDIDMIQGDAVFEIEKDRFPSQYFIGVR